MEEVSYYKTLISKGDMFQVVPSRIYKYKHFFENENKDTLKLQMYKNLKRQNPSPYMYYIDDEERTIIGSSPESFIKKEGKIITTNPIAGTNKRGKTEEEDLANEQALINDEKELSEHRMLVDLGRNDLNIIAKTGSVHMPKLMTVERFEHVMHIVTIVEGEISNAASNDYSFTPSWHSFRCTEDASYNAYIRNEKTKKRYIRWWRWLYKL